MARVMIYEPDAAKVLFAGLPLTRAKRLTPWVDTLAEREDNARLIDGGEIPSLPFVEVPWPPSGDR